MISPLTRDRLADWLEAHKIGNGKGYDCVQARDVAQILEEEA